MNLELPRKLLLPVFENELSEETKTTAVVNLAQRPFALLSKPAERRQVSPCNLLEKILWTFRFFSL